LGILVITCPNTGREIETGLEVDSRTYQSIPMLFSRTYCSTWRTNHVWFAKDAKVVDEVATRAVQRSASGAPIGRAQFKPSWASR
jgi:hypothetical protein